MLSEQVSLFRFSRLAVVSALIAIPEAAGAEKKPSVLLEEDKKYAEAVEHLEAIDPNGSLSGGREMVLPRVRKAVEAKKAKKPGAVK